MSALNGPPTVAIVGGGAVGVALFDALVDRLAADGARAKGRVVLFEKGERVGPGLAYGRDESPYLLNQSAQTMALAPGRRAEFAEWLASRGLARGDEGELFCERRLFGDYVEERFARAVDRARRRGVAVTIVRDEVTGLDARRFGGHRVTTRGHAPIDADVTVLALGNLRSTRFRALEGPGFVASPYPGADLRARVAKSARVAILGTGLSAIDAALALFAAGHEGPVTMASRGGMLPAVRGPLAPCELRHVTRESVARATDHGRLPLRWPTILRWLELELAHHGHAVAWDRDFPAWADPLAHCAAQVEAAQRGPRAWQSVGEALNPMIEVLWRYLAREDRAIFLERFYARFMSHWVPIPLVTGRRVLDALRAGRLAVARGLTGIARDEGTGYRLHLAGGVLDADVVIDATGAARRLADADSPLLAALAAQGTIAAHEHGGLRVDFDTLRVVGREGRADPTLFALGGLTFGTHLFTSTLEQNVEKAARVASLVAAELHRLRDKEHHADATPHPT